MNLRRVLTALVFATMLVTGASAQDLEEVEVVGKKLSQLRAEIVEAEDRFYALYNELNTNDDFDITCSMETRTGTLISARVCKTAFYAKAQQEEAQAFLQGRISTPPDLVVMTRRDEYRKSVVDLVKGNAELLRLSQEQYTLRKKYEETRKQRFKDRWILLE